MKVPGLLIFLSFTVQMAFPAGFTGGINWKDRYQAVDSLNRLGEYFLEKNPEMVEIMGSRARIRSIVLNYTKGEVDALSLLSKYYLTKENYVRTLEQYFAIIDIYDHTKKTRELVIGYTRIIQFFLLIKDYELVKKYLAVMAGLVKKSEDPENQGLLFISQAKYYLAIADYDMATRYCFLSILNFQRAHNLSSEGNAYKFLGDTYVQKKMYDKAEYNYRLALMFFTQNSNPPEVAVIYTRIAHIHQVLNNNRLNLEFNLAAMKVREKIGHSYPIASSCLNVGEAYWFLGRKDMADFYLQKSLITAERIKSTFLLEAIYSQLSDFAKAEKRFDLALKYFTSCVECRNKMNFDRNQSEISILVANRAIRASEMQNDLIKQEVLIQDLQIRNSGFQIFFFEVMLITILAILIFFDALTRKNRKRKNELLGLNSRLNEEIDTRIKAEGRLSRSEELHRFLAENTVDVISLLDATMHRLYISQSCEKFYGYTVDDILQMRSPLDLVESSFHVSVNQSLLEMFRKKSSTRYIYKALRKNGDTFWAETNINPILEPATGEVRNLITVVRDVSDRMKHEEELSENSRQKEYLLREIHHRVKNNFAILISLMNMQREQSADTVLSASLTDLQLRVRTMSLVHEQLYMTQEISTIPFDKYLHNLTSIISSSFNNDRIRLKTDIHPCKVAIELALPLGLIVNELITNAYKYAFPGDLTGTISVNLCRENHEIFCVIISDDGVGLPEDFTMNNPGSMGSQIVGILVEQIEAKLEVSSKEGACFRILFSTVQEK